MAEQLITVTAYVAAFETWRDLARLTDGERKALDLALDRLRETGYAEPRKIETFCEALDGYLANDRRSDARGGLRLRITKSCLLDRLVYLGEAARMVRCPTHEGRWSGLSVELCPDGCNLASCGCKTGWLPTRATLVAGEASYVEAVAHAERRRQQDQARVWREHLAAVRAALAEGRHGE